MTQKEECLRLMGTPINDSCKVDYIELVRVGVDCEDLKGETLDELKDFRSEKSRFMIDQVCKFPLDNIEQLKNKQPKFIKAYDNNLDQVAWESIYEELEREHVIKHLTPPPTKESKKEPDKWMQKIKNTPMAHIYRVKKTPKTISIEEKPIFLKEEDIDKLLEGANTWLFKDNTRDRMSRKVFADWYHNLDKKQKTMINYRINKQFIRE